MVNFKLLSALLIFHTHNIHMLHWKVCGANFQKNHEFLDGLYSEMLGHIDLLVEIGMQYPDYTPPTLQEALELLDGDGENNHMLIESGISYEGDAAFDCVKKIFEEILKQFDAAYEELLKYHQAEIDVLQSWYSKNSRYLIQRRLLK